MPDEQRNDNPAPGSATGAGAGATAVAHAKPSRATKNKPQQLPPYNVVLLNDDDHTLEYVIEMLKALFGHPTEMGLQLGMQVDRAGRAIVYTTHKEKAELKRDQIHAFGADKRIPTCAGAMSAIIEPAATE
jgi:ATP-dependent Clp protease adaptor protein ClpS